MTHPNETDNALLEMPNAISAFKELTDLLEKSRNLHGELTSLVAHSKSAGVEIEQNKLAIDNAKIAAENASASAENEHQRAAKSASSSEVIRTQAEAEKDKSAAAASEAATYKTDAQANLNITLQAKTTSETTISNIAAEQRKAQLASKAADTAKLSAEESLRSAINANTDAANAAASAKTSHEGAISSANNAKSAEDRAASAKDEAEKSSVKAEAEAKRATEAHNLSTTAGLAGAFNDKATGTKNRERFWSCMLVLSLGTVAWIGWERYSLLSAFLNSKPEASTLLANVVLALLGIGAPAWLAWVSTKMISQNFALTEDYAYKASLAKAYVGFRDQARGLDPIFEQRLFAAAITQLDANPVRFIDSSHPGSPLQDLLQQPFMQEFMQDTSIKKQMVDWLKSRFGTKISIPAKTENAVIKSEVQPLNTA